MGKCFDRLVAIDIHANYPVWFGSQLYNEPCVVFLDECKCADEIVTLNWQPVTCHNQPKSWSEFNQDWQGAVLVKAANQCDKIMVECVGLGNKIFPVHVPKTFDQGTRGEFQCQR